MQPHDLRNQKIVRKTGRKFGYVKAMIGLWDVRRRFKYTVHLHIAYSSPRATHQQIQILPFKWPPILRWWMYPRLGAPTKCQGPLLTLT